MMTTGVIKTRSLKGMSRLRRIVTLNFMQNDKDRLDLTSVSSCAMIVV